MGIRTTALVGAMAGAALASFAGWSTAGFRSPPRLSDGRSDAERAWASLSSERSSRSGSERERARSGTAGGDRRSEEAALAADDGAPPEELRRRNALLAVRLNELHERLAVIEAQIHNGLDRDRQVRPYALNREAFVALADRCALTWDMPSVADKAQVPELDARELALDPGQRDAVNEVFADNDTFVRGEVRKLYVEVTGDRDGAENLSSQTMWHEIEDKTPKETLRQVFQQLAGERAGRAQPEKGVAGPPAERLFRLLTASGDRVEKQIAARVGTDVARRLRDLHNGFSSRWTSSYGCPP